VNTASAGGPGVLVGQEARLHALDVGQPGRGGPAARFGEHRRGDVHRDHAAHARGGGQRESPGSGAEVHHGGFLAGAVRGQHSDVGREIRGALLPVEPGDETGVEVLRASVSQFVDHPALGVHGGDCPARCLDCHRVFAGLPATPGAR
jgi:hypothetical protein